MYIPLNIVSIGSTGSSALKWNISLNFQAVYKISVSTELSMSDTCHTGGNTISKPFPISNCILKEMSPIAWCITYSRIRTSLIITSMHFQGFLWILAFCQKRSMICQLKILTQSQNLNNLSSGGWGTLPDCSTKIGGGAKWWNVNITMEMR